ncbi:MAG: hypothetical protein P8Y63_14080 [Deltaproteobacteria bacterium]|jgi:hypothetical protein
MLEKEQCVLYSGGHQGAERAFAEAAAKRDIKVVNLTFAGHTTAQDSNAVILSDEELRRGDISMELASKMMHRTYYGAQRIRKVLQTIFHMVNNGHQIFAVGIIQADNTVKGGTGWAVELAKLFNRPVSVFDQGQNKWFTWKEGVWREDSPRISHHTFVGSGTRNLNEQGRQAIEELFAHSFGAS